MNHQPFVIERVFNAPIEKVWKAITDKDQMKQWYFDIPGFRAEVGCEFTFEGGTEENCYLHLCKVTEVIEGRKLTYSWRYDGHEGNSFVTFELFSEGEQTRLRLTHEGLETFPAIPDFAKENFVMGWTDLIGRLLKEFVENETIRRTLELNAPVSKVWDIMINHDNIKQWASAFYPGTYVDTDWKVGSGVSWKTPDGSVGAKGIVVANETAQLLKVSYFDDVNMSPPAETGKYSEVYSFKEEGGKTVLSIEAGPLPAEHASKHAPLWDNALQKVKELAEKDQ